MDAPALPRRAMGDDGGTGSPAAAPPDAWIPGSTGASSHLTAA